jgi:hypothetical protein
MADAADLKSVVRKDVRVRLPPSAPLSTLFSTATCIVPVIASCALLYVRCGKDERLNLARSSFEFDYLTQCSVKFSTSRSNTARAAQA